MLNGSSYKELNVSYEGCIFCLVRRGIMSGGEEGWTQEPSTLTPGWLLAGGNLFPVQ